MLVAVKKWGGALEFASKELKNDKEVAIEAIKQYWDAFKFVGPEAQKEIINLLTK